MILKKSYNYGLTKKVALFTNARDELHIKEWVAHHLLIGFDQIIIFDHKSVTPLKNIFQHFNKHVTISRVDTDGPVKLQLMNNAKYVNTIFVGLIFRFVFC